MSLPKLALHDVQDQATLRLDVMDTQHNERSAAARSSAASPERAGPNTAAVMKNVSIGSPNGIRSSPPILTKDDAMALDQPHSSPDHGTGKSDSEAETIVLPGKDGHSPSKTRKSIKHEDKSDDDDNNNKHRPHPNAHRHQTKGPIRNADQERERERGRGRGRENEKEKFGESSSNATSTLGKRKRAKLNGIDDTHHLGNSSGLSSVPTSPVATTRSSLSKPAASDSDISKSPSASPIPRPSLRDKAKSVDRALSRKKRYDPDSGEEDDIEERRSIRQRLPGTRPLDAKPRKETRSISPQPRSHRRSISTQLPAKSSSYASSHKKKRIPPPLQSTEYQSDDSSASGGSFPRSSRLRSLVAPHTGDSTMSPIKTGSHKKHVNSSGQTFLQRACASNKPDQLVQVKQRYEERPQDLNESDHAGNTPLHSASIHGYAKVVKFLLATGNCIVDPLNIQKDTPLHDSLENGHVNVVKLLLEAGADPRKPKGDGKDPLDIIAEQADQDDDDPERLAEWNQMRDLITNAIKKHPSGRQESEEERGERGLSQVTESPRHTPPVHGHEFPSMQGGTRRAGVGTSRQVKTKDGNLYQPMNLAELRKAARDGDNDTTARILEVMPNTNDPKTLWLSARGGHSDTMEFQLAMGKFDPDPSPLEDGEAGKDTPFLVAIGRSSHTSVLKLLLAHGVDPTRLNNNETYYEIARNRKGPNWQEETAILKEAYDKWKKNAKSTPAKPRSPGLRRDMRDSNREKRSLQKDEQPVMAPRPHKRSTSDPKTKEPTSKPLHRRNSSSIDQSKEQQLTKRGPGRPRKEESMASTAISDRESSPLAPPKPKALSRKSESELTAASDNETAAKPRRKLISGKEYRGERDLEKHRRTSVVSTTSNVSVKDKRERATADGKSEKLDRASPNLSRNTSKPHENEHTPDRHLLDKERARSLKRDDSKDRLSAIRGESPVKRPRKNSETPPRSSGQENSSNYSTSGGAQKRRKLEGDSRRNFESTPSSSPEHHSKVKSNLSRESSVRSSTDTHKQPRSMKTIGEASKEVKKPITPSDPTLKPIAKMSSHSSGHEASGKVLKSHHSGPTGKEESLSSSKSSKDEEAKEARQRREKEARDLAKKQEEEEKQEALRIEEAKQARLAREQAAKEEEAKREREDTERKERQRQDDADARARAVEEQRALYLEQERIKKEDQERRRAIVLEQQRAEKARMEKQRREDELAKLPYLLRWFDLVPEPKTSDIASLFKTIPGYRLDTIQPEMTGQPNGREQWMLNTQVATLLGERDLQLSRCK